MSTYSFAIGTDPYSMKNNFPSYEESEDKIRIVNNSPNSNYYELSNIDLNENFGGASKFSLYKKENTMEILTSRINYNEEDDNIQDNNIYFLRKVIERKNIFEVIYPLFTFSRKENDLIKYCESEKMFTIF